MNNPELISPELISNVINDFYDVAKSDFMIGYHFRVIDNFDRHIPRIIGFWELQLVGKTDYKSNEAFDLINIHKPLGIKLGELNRWVILFKESLKKNNVCPEDQSKWLKKIEFFREKLEKFLIN